MTARRTRICGGGRHSPPGEFTCKKPFTTAPFYLVHSDNLPTVIAACLQKHSLCLAQKCQLKRTANGPKRCTAICRRELEAVLVVFSCNHGRQAEAGKRQSNESHQQSFCQYSSLSAAPFSSL